MSVADCLRDILLFGHGITQMKRAVQQTTLEPTFGGLFPRAIARLSPRHEAQALLPQKSADVTTRVNSSASRADEIGRRLTSSPPIPTECLSAMYRVAKEWSCPMATNCWKQDFGKVQVRISSSGDDRSWPKGDLAIAPSSFF